MRKILVVLVIMCLLAVPIFAATSDTKSSGNTATFSTVINIASFNSVTNWIHLRNESTVADCYVILGCQKGVAFADRVLKLPASGTQTPNTVEFKYTTGAIGFISNKLAPADSGANNAQIHYFVTGDQGDL